MKEQLAPQSCFSFTDREKLYDKVSHNRLVALLMQPDIDVHEVELSTNSFGEYLFVTLSCRAEQPKKLWIFWGLGYHEYRERWIVDTWQWFESFRQAEQLPKVSKQEAYMQIKEREAFVRAQVNPATSSRSAQMYELLAEFTDEDGALAELEDLGWTLLSDDEEDV